MKLSSDGGDCGSRKRKRGCGGAYGVVWRSLLLAAVWSQAVGFVLVRLAGIGLQSALTTFSHRICFLKKSYKFCTFSAICKDNAYKLHCSSTLSKKKKKVYSRQF
jgi:hypothetical protein